MSKKPYNGTQRKLVLAFDVGTTFSGVSYAVLTPGELPKISGINRFPGQENVGGDSKIPTVIYYDESGQPCATGAETLDPRNVDLADEKGFKMHLRPKSMGSTVDGTKIPRLPKGKTVVDVFADFLRYLFECARTYISETHAAGDVLWDSVADKMHFILTHTNGWEGPQQARMRRSALLAGLVPNTPEGRSRVQFVTEGEASLHFCIRSGLADDLIKPGKTIIIADAGGGTIDVSSYRFTSVDPAVEVEESAVPECKAQGAVFVTRRAHEHLKRFLSGSKYGSREDINAIAEVFDKTTKHIFRDDSQPWYIKFAAPKDKDLNFNIRNGQLKLDGLVVAGFFERSIQSVVDVIKSQNGGSSVLRKILSSSAGGTPVFLVGGFAASPWLFSQLQQRLRVLGCSLYRPDSHTNKAVADGAISFYLDHFVTERIARTTLGVHVHIHFQKRNAEHRRRSASKYVDIAGTLRVPYAFNTLIKKGTLVSETTEFRIALSNTSSKRDGLCFVDSALISYVGGNNDPRWTDEKPEDFVTYCTISADMSNMTKALSSHQSPTNVTYFRSHYDVVLLFGLTETQAFLAWQENGVEKRGPATIVYDDPIPEYDEGDDRDNCASSSEDEEDDINERRASNEEIAEEPDAGTKLVPFTTLEYSDGLKTPPEIEGGNQTAVVISDEFFIETKETETDREEDNWELA